MNKELEKLLKKRHLNDFGILASPKATRELVEKSTHFKERILNFKSNMLKMSKEQTESEWFKRLRQDQRDYWTSIPRIFELAEQEGLDDIDLIFIWVRIQKKRQDQKALYKAKPVKEGRDNKGVHVGSGYPQGNTIRYPSKKRSKRTWANFYKLFPRLAVADGWNGTTSNKMK